MPAVPLLLAKARSNIAAPIIRRLTEANPSIEAYFLNVIQTAPRFISLIILLAILGAYHNWTFTARRLQKADKLSHCPRRRSSEAHCADIGGCVILVL